MFGLPVFPLEFDSDCIGIFTDSDQTATGPANSDIVGLTHGISFLLVLVLTIAIITMGSKISRPAEPNTEKGIMRKHLEGKYNPPPLPSKLHGLFGKPEPPPKASSPDSVPTATAADKAKDIVQCANLLREMYRLDLLIFGKKDAVIEETHEREEMKYKADAIYNEVRRKMSTWRGEDSFWRWTGEERKIVDEICKSMEQHRRRMYGYA